MEVKIIICLHCKKEIKRPKINQKYHENCYIEYRRQYKREKEKEYYYKKTKLTKEKICKSCEKIFTATHGNQLYCSDICKKDYKSRLKGFKSYMEEISFKGRYEHPMSLGDGKIIPKDDYKSSRLCYKCLNPLTYDAHLDTYKCLFCGYTRRYPTPMKEDSYPRIKFTKSPHDYPYDYNMQELRGKQQNQNIDYISSKSERLSLGAKLPKDLFCESCGMLKNRCNCK